MPCDKCGKYTKKCGASDVSLCNECKPYMLVAVLAILFIAGICFFNL